MNSPPFINEPDAQAALAVLRPLARLTLARGLQLAQLEVLLKEALFDAGREALKADPTGQPIEKRKAARDSASNASLLSALTGINRKDVALKLRASNAEQSTAGVSGAERASIPSQIVGRWLEWVSRDPSLSWLPVDAAKAPSESTAGADAPSLASFEALANAFTRKNVHHRAMLELLCRSGAARREGNYLVLQSSSYVPQGDGAQMVALLGAHIGDHLQAAVSNVLGKGSPRLEQAVFVDDIEPQAALEIEAAARQMWQHMHDQIYALMDLAQQQALANKVIAHKAASSTGKTQTAQVPQVQPLLRMKVGVYVYSHAQPEAATLAATTNSDTVSKTTTTSKRKTKGRTT